MSKIDDPFEAEWEALNEPGSAGATGLNRHSLSLGSLFGGSNVFNDHQSGNNWRKAEASYGHVNCSA